MSVTFCVSKWLKSKVSIPQQSENIQTILERTLNLIFPERYKRLRQLAVDMECNCILELIDTLIDTHAQDSDVRELRAGFENANRADNGLPIEYGHRYVRKHHRTPDSIQPTLDL